MPKTNAVRILEKEKIPFEVIDYGYSDDAIDAVTVADTIGAAHDEVYKTLVTTSGNQYYVFVIPGNKELSLKKAAAVCGEKSIELIPVNEIQKVTGYIKGGCSPIGMKKNLPTFIDESAANKEIIYCSAGKRGMQLKLKPADLAKTLKAGYGILVR